MRIDAKALGSAAVIVAAVSFTICAFFVAIAPAATIGAFSYVMHIDLSAMTRSITWGSFFGSLVIFSAVIGVHAVVLGWLYNALVGTTQGAGRATAPTNAPSPALHG